MLATTKAFLITLMAIAAMLGIAIIQARFIEPMPISRSAAAAIPRGARLRLVEPLWRSSTDITVPVEGVERSELADTWGAARSLGRLHQGVDIMAPAGSHVRAAAPGQVMKLYASKRGGITIYERSADGRHIFYYAHLLGYAPGLKEGDNIQRGQVIGFVGMTGNAPVPHLHFEIQRAAADGKWWRGEAVNPYPLLISGRVDEAIN